uniref:Uncharacterized protein n=1 Tax=Panagrolaimus sp. JU765 TaxID=591449 RepID=A0AC34R7N6_9BILA
MGQSGQPEQPTEEIALGMKNIGPIPPGAVYTVPALPLTVPASRNALITQVVGVGQEGTNRNRRVFGDVSTKHSPVEVQKQKDRQHAVSPKIEAMTSMIVGFGLVVPV